MENISLKKIILPNPIQSGYTIYGITNCKYCKLAKEYLFKNENNISFLFINIEDYLIDNYKQIFNQEFNLNINKEHKTVPIIFFNNNFIGGYTELINNNSNKDNNILLNNTDDF